MNRQSDGAESAKRIQRGYTAMKIAAFTGLIWMVIEGSWWLGLWSGIRPLKIVGSTSFFIAMPALAYWLYTEWTTGGTHVP